MRSYPVANDIDASCYSSAVPPSGPTRGIALLGFPISICPLDKHRPQLWPKRGQLITADLRSRVREPGKGALWLLFAHLGPLKDQAAGRGTSLSRARTQMASWPRSCRLAGEQALVAMLGILLSAHLHPNLECCSLTNFHLRGSRTMERLL